MKNKEQRIGNRKYYLITRLGLLTLRACLACLPVQRYSMKAVTQAIPSPAWQNICEKYQIERDTHQ